MKTSQHWMRNCASAIALLLSAAAVAAPPKADTLYQNGYVYTVDAHDSVQQAIATRDGRIVYVGDNHGAQALVGASTKVVDLHGRMLMPGLIDGHMHPMMGGAQLLACNLNYEALTIAQFQSRIQACLDQQKGKDDSQWLMVVNWFQQNMLPQGTEATRATLDALPTARPVIVLSSFGHSTLANTRALQLAHIDRTTPNPAAGSITRDASGEATGILEDLAQDLVVKLLPAPTATENLAAAAAALAALREQGVTSFLDAMAERDGLLAFTTLQQQGKLTARAHFAPRIPPEDGPQAGKAVADVVALARQFDQGAIKPSPSVTLRNAKLFMDGVIAAPALTGSMVEPYFVDQGTPQQPHWVPGTSRGPATYFPPKVLQALLLGLCKAGLDPHIHVDGDGAVHETLDALRVMRAAPGCKAVRPALAHDEIVVPDDFGRFAELNATAVLSLQWGKPAPDTVAGLKTYLGPQRYAILEPQELLLKAGTRIAYGSDWPVDPLNEWFALKVGVTRTNAPEAGPEFAGKLGPQNGLPRAAALRAITMNSAYTLRQESQTGSLEVGKLADLIVLDRNFFTIDAEDIANIKVLQTMVGGKVVYQSQDFD